jgi:phospholipase/carboxylesterase
MRDASRAKAGQSEALATDPHRQGILTWKPVPRSQISAEAWVAGKSGTNPIGLGSRRDGLAYIPESALPDNPRPLLIMFHGAGASATDVLPMIAEAAERQAVMVLAPDSRGATWDVLQHEYGPDVAFLERALDKVFHHGAVDWGRIAFAGFSDGGSYALSLGLINSELVSDVLGFSPGFVAPTRTEDARGSSSAMDGKNRFFRSSAAAATLHAHCGRRATMWTTGSSAAATSCPPT